MFEVGDSVRLAAVARDPDGNPSDPAGGVMVSVKQPDGTQTAPAAATKVSVGTYTFDFTGVQAGRHVGRFAGAGFAFTDVFSVWPTDPGMLFGLEEARAQLRIRSGQTAFDDEMLRLFVVSTTPVIEDIVGPLLPAVKVRVADGGVDSVLLGASPVKADTVTITESGTPMLDFTVNESAGIVHGGTRQAPRPFLWGRQNVVITYGVGAGVVPPNVLLAAKEEFRFLFQNSQQAARPSLRAGGGETPVDYTPSGFAVPRRVIELCGSLRRLGGFA